MKTITDTTSGILSKQHNMKRCITSLVALSLCLALTFMASTITPNTSSWLYLSLITIGVVGALIALVMLIFGGKSLFYIPTKSPIKELSLFFKSDEISNLMYSIETCKLDNLAQIVSPSDSGVRLDATISRDNSFAACQIMKYVPYNYEAASAVYRIPSQHVHLFARLIKELSSKQ